MQPARFKRTFKAAVVVSAISLMVLAPSFACPALAQGERSAQALAKFFEDVRAGDLAAVRDALESGIDVNAEDRYGATAVFKAASAGHLQLVEFLLEQGANADVKESFWGQRAIDAAFAAEQFEILATLVKAGASGREDAFQMALRSSGAEPERSLLVAQVAVESGPFFESALERLRSLSPPEAFGDLLDQVRTRPDLPPPVLSRAELEKYEGIYEGWSDDRRVVVELEGDHLFMAVDGGAAQQLKPVAPELFTTANEAVRVNYFGRFGSVEGIFLSGTLQGALRRSVAEPVKRAGAAADAADASRSSKKPVRSTVHWPSFRGANGDGIGDGKPTPTSWDLASGENVLWKAKLEGLGNSSPVIWGDQVFLTTAVASGIEQEVVTGDTGSGADVAEAVAHSWQVLAFDKRTGKQQWATEVGTGVPKTRRHFKASQANSTPATNGKVVVAVFPTAGLAALDFKGNVLWHHDLGALNASNFFDPEDQWGFASSPIIYRDTVILQVDTFGDGYLAAWRLSDGQQLWKTERDVATSWATPSILTTEKGDELIVNASNIRGYDPATGEQLWSLGPNSELVIARPVIGDQIAYVSAGYAPVKPVYAIRGGLRGDLEVKPGTEHGALLWSHRIGGAYMPSPLLYGGKLYVVHHNGRIVAYDAVSGEALMKSRFSKGGQFTGSPVANNGRLYVPTEGGLMYVLDSGTDYKEIAVNDFDEPLMASPSISEGVLFVRTPKHLFALGNKD